MSTTEAAKTVVGIAQLMCLAGIIICLIIGKLGAAILILILLLCIDVKGD